MMNVYDELKERGFIAQATHENEIRDLFEKEKVTFYIKFSASTSPAKPIPRWSRARYLYLFIPVSFPHPDNSRQNISALL